ncbi:hypothetical protein TNCV_4690611 [Trichonephila clavipes]|nr:hypothetical protein TNCV_4690611 [Trichonephila clavipes]
MALGLEPVIGWQRVRENSPLANVVFHGQDQRPYHEKPPHTMIFLKPSIAVILVQSLNHLLGPSIELQNRKARYINEEPFSTCLQPNDDELCNIVIDAAAQPCNHLRPFNFRHGDGVCGYFWPDNLLVSLNHTSFR